MTNHDAHAQPHIVSARVYFMIFGALILCTALTVWISFIDLGFLNTVLAITIAVLKATLVILYFMHVRYGSRLIWLIAAAGFFWFVLLLALGMSDYMTRQPITFPFG